MTLNPTQPRLWIRKVTLRTNPTVAAVPLIREAFHEVLDDSEELPTFLGGAPPCHSRAFPLFGQLMFKRLNELALPGSHHITARL